MIHKINKFFWVGLFALTLNTITYSSASPKISLRITIPDSPETPRLSKGAVNRIPPVPKNGCAEKVEQERIIAHNTNLRTTKRCCTCIYVALAGIGVYAWYHFLTK